MNAYARMGVLYFVIYNPDFWRRDSVTASCNSTSHIGAEYKVLASRRAES
jgi:hypothetical protein